MGLQCGLVKKFVGKKWFDNEVSGLDFWDHGRRILLSVAEISATHK